MSTKSVDFWTADDYDCGLCTAEQIGQPVFDNPVEQLPGAPGAAEPDADEPETVEEIEVMLENSNDAEFVRRVRALRKAFETDGGVAPTVLANIMSGVRAELREERELERAKADRLKLPVEQMSSPEIRQRIFGHLDNPEAAAEIVRRAAAGVELLLSKFVPKKDWAAAQKALLKMK